MLKFKSKMICTLMALVMLITAFPVIPVEATTDYDKVGYIAVRVMPDGDVSYHQALLRRERIYLSEHDIALISGYTLLENVQDGAYFYRPNDWMTAVSYFDGEAHTMGYVYDLETIVRDGERFFDVEYMLYLLHAQWVVENNQLVVQPMTGNLFEF